MNVALCAIKSGRTIFIDTDDLSLIDELGSALETVLIYEFKAGLAGYLSRLGSKARIKSLKEIIDFNDRNKQLEMAYFGQNLLLAAEDAGPLTDYKYVEALAKCRRLLRTEGIDAVMAAHDLDALIAPTVGPACMIDLINGDRWLGGSVAAAGDCRRIPSITVPAGFVFGLPVGMSFFGRAWSEPTLLKLAYAF